MYLMLTVIKFMMPMWLNTLRPRQNSLRFADDVFKCIFLSDNASILIKFSLKFIPNGQIDNIPSLVQVMAWRRLGDKPLSETMMVKLSTHICVTRPQWVKGSISLTYLLCVLHICNIAFQRYFRRLTHWGRDKLAAASQTTFSNAFSWVKMYEFWLKFHWSLFLGDQSIIFHHWFR